jgi:hypothetical protein
MAGFTQWCNSGLGYGCDWCACGMVAEFLQPMLLTVIVNSALFRKAVYDGYPEYQS